MPWAGERLGPTRLRHAYAWASLIEAGSIIPAGSDAPVEDPSPLRGFYAAITRQREDGTPAGGWVPEERMSREEALKAYTSWGAYGSFHEEAKGTIEIGKWADLVVLSEDILSVEERKIPDTAVELTIVGGEVTHSRPGLFAGR
jgi:predicted amidohydrolase YtcJ